MTPEENDAAVKQLRDITVEICARMDAAVVVVAFKHADRGPKGWYVSMCDMGPEQHRPAMMASAIHECGQAIMTGSATRGEAMPRPRRQ